MHGAVRQARVCATLGPAGFTVSVSACWPEAAAGGQDKQPSAAVHIIADRRAHAQSQGSDRPPGCRGQAVHTLRLQAEGVSCLSVTTAAPAPTQSDCRAYRSANKGERY